MKKCPICGQDVPNNPCVDSKGKCTECHRELEHKQK